MKRTAHKGGGNMLEVTAKAIEKLREVLLGQTKDPEIAIRVTPNYSTPKRLDLILDKVKKGDRVIETKEGTKVLLIRSDLAKDLEGLVLDYKDTLEDFTIAKITRH
jgi:Fe-S cluster assembly iron-binding protein IscA